jgi:ubiquinone/menaquinone biosynthesis C-methylase UbiE
MSSVWDERAEAYRTSEAHREGEDLDLLVEWAQGARTALDVATGGGHVARRFRDAGLEVVSLDPAPGMEPDVVAPAESLPFDDGSFDVVACRVAAHHFEDVRAAVREMARVSRDRVLVSDNLFVDEQSEEADRVRDASHVRNYTEAEWRSFFAEAGLEVERAHTYMHPVLLEPWLERAGCRGKDAERVRELVARRMDGDRVRLERICLKGRKRGEG